MDKNLQTAIIYVMYAKCVGLRDHSIRTAEIAEKLATRLQDNGIDLGCTPDDAYSGGLVHDIGKIFISESILNKTQGLTERETEIMNLHPSWGLQFVENVGLERYSSVVFQHHENAIGTGYPQGLSAAEMDPLAKIIRIADLLSALLEDRPYRRGIVDEGFILSKMEQDIEGFFNGSSTIIRAAILDCLTVYRSQIMKRNQLSI